jgi:hypothetical protein
MSLLQSLWATGQRNTPYGDCAGDEVVQVFEFTMPATAPAANDIIELAVLPATHTVTDAILVSEALDTLAVDIGIMSGEVGDKDSPRTCGAELFAAQAVDGTVVRTELVSAFTIPPTDNHRSIGAKVTTAPGAAVAGKKLRLLLKYAPA